MILSSLASSVSASALERPASAPAAANAAGASDFAGLVSARQAEAAAEAARDEAARFHHQTSHSGELEPLQRFESFVLRSFVESMLPDKNTSFFGTGTAGQIWKSMLAERIGDEMAASGGIGIADMLAKREASATPADTK
ncbi:rod-binding protein [Aureimonas ureilytica]|uniref:rod-binding protein n=1 Tax=Aureimonas ureilytica TaxID=401562 RepID=UPI003CF51709